MTFEEWWSGAREVPQTKAAAQEAWFAGQAAERERCAKLVETQDPNGDYGVSGWFELLAAKIRA